MPTSHMFSIYVWISLDMCIHQCDTIIICKVLHISIIHTSLSFFYVRVCRCVRCVCMCVCVGCSRKIHYQIDCLHIFFLCSVFPVFIGKCSITEPHPCHPLLSVILFWHKVLQLSENLTWEEGIPGGNLLQDGLKFVIWVYLSLTILLTTDVCQYALAWIFL